VSRQVGIVSPPMASTGRGLWIGLIRDISIICCEPRSTGRVCRSSRGINDIEAAPLSADFLNIPFVQPPLDEAAADRAVSGLARAQTAKLIRVKKKLIALLNEQKQPSSTAPSPAASTRSEAQAIRCSVARRRTGRVDVIPFKRCIASKRGRALWLLTSERSEFRSCALLAYIEMSERSMMHFPWTPMWWKGVGRISGSERETT